MPWRFQRFSKPIIFLSQTAVFMCVGSVVLALSFFGTLWILDTFWPLSSASTPPFPHIMLNQKLEFANGMNSSALISGWSTPEAGGVWTDGNEAHLGLIIVNGDGKPKLRLSFEGQAAIFPEAPQQKIELWARNIKLNEMFFTTSAATFSVSLAELKISSGAYPLELTLKLPLAVIVESRKLGFGLISVRLES
jgi:hypothetical protein